MINPRSKQTKKLLDDAEIAGYSVTHEEGGHIVIKSRIRGRPGVTITEDGHCFRNDIRDLTIATNIGSLKVVRKLLNLPEEI
jgi:hypothetical protein